MLRRARWLTPLLLLLAILVASLPGHGASSISRWYVLRAKADLAASANVNTGPVACLGARQVVFFIRTPTADTDACSTMTVQVSNDETNWANSALATSTVAVGGGAIAVNGAGTMISLTCNTAVNGSAYIPWARARLNLVNKSAGAIDSVYVLGLVVDDAGSLNVQRERLAPPQ